MKKLTLKDLLTCPNTGWGFVGHYVRTPGAWSDHADPYACIRTIDEAVLRVANIRGMSREQLHTFMQSRPARHMGDFFEGNLPTAEGALVAQVMSFFDWADGE